MRCESLGPRLSAWVDGELSMLDAWLVSRHVASCPTCAAEVDEMRALNAQLSAANPVLNPLLVSIKPRRSVTPLVGAGALVATGVAGFFLLPRLPQPEPIPATSASAPPARVAMNQPEKARLEGTLKNVIAPSSAVTSESPVPKKLPPPPKPEIRVAETSRRSVDRDSPRRSVARTKRTVRRSAIETFGRARKHKPSAVLPTNGIQVAKASAAELVERHSTTPDSMTASDKAMLAKDAVERSNRDTAAMAASPEAVSALKPATPVVTPPATVAEPDLSNFAKKNDLRARLPITSRASSRAIATMRTREEGQDSAAPRKRVVPVLVVTPTRYENVVTVTAGALEVDDTDDKEETPQL